MGRPRRSGIVNAVKRNPNDRSVMGHAAYDPRAFEVLALGRLGLSMGSPNLLCLGIGISPTVDGWHRLATYDPRVFEVLTLGRLSWSSSLI